MQGNRQSVGQLLLELEKQKIEKLNGGVESMLNLLDKMVQFQRECAADPMRPGYRRKAYSEQKHRESFIRPKSRLFYYDDKNFQD